ncbi:MAG: DUF4260 domain-containing protein [Candidatus Saccharimonadales bacterium]
MQNTFMKQLISSEYLIAAILVAIFYVVVGNFDWWWLPILFLVPDVSMAGYLLNPRVGAAIYNIGHSLIGPVILVAIYIATDNQIILFASLIWLFHILIDRAFGYGLKHATSFKHTHLGHVGKKK